MEYLEGFLWVFGLVNIVLAFLMLKYPDRAIKLFLTENWKTLYDLYGEKKGKKVLLLFSVPMLIGGSLMIAVALLMNLQ